jgi:5-methylcytosine-specific restriction endonuclease McrA
MTMPKGVTSKEIDRALDWIDLHEREIPKNQRVRKFALLRGNDKKKEYPPKFVIRKAYSFLGESSWTGIFSGGNETNNFLIRKQFKVWDRARQKFVGLEAVDESPEKIFKEGRVLAKYEKHIRIERRGSLPKHAKGLRLKSDPYLRCDVCGFSFVETYGDIGDGFIEAHHLVPLAHLHGERAVRAADLALVCSNCHRMLHRSNPLLRPERLGELVKSRKKQ